MYTMSQVQICACTRIGIWQMYILSLIHILDNAYEGQKGSWLSTCGNVYDYFGDYEIDQALYAVDDYIDESPYKAYKNCISYVTVSYTHLDVYKRQGMRLSETVAEASGVQFQTFSLLH